MSLSPDRITLRNTCRACPEVALEPLLDLGHLHLSAFPPAVDSPPAYPRVPLTLMACPACQLVQLRHTTPFAWLFGGQYWYRSGVNEAMVEELTDVVRDAATRVGGLSKADTVLDIGANDGTLLAAYGSRHDGGPVRVAFEPSTSMYEALRGRTDVLYADAFPPCAPILRQELAQMAGTVKVITAVAMVYDLEDPHGFFQACAELLHPDGVLILQFQDLLGMLQQTAFDCVCHEHLEYYSLWALSRILGAHDLWVVDVLPRAINGGSLRVIVRPIRTGRAQGSDPRVTAQYDAEELAGLTDHVGLQTATAAFGRRIADVGTQIRAMLTAVHDQGGTVDLYGASTKGNTLLQVLEIGHTWIRQAIERSPEKWGRAVGYTGIPIVSEAEGRADPASVWLVSIWQFREGVIRREREYLHGGGALLFPLPYTRVVQELVRSAA